MLWSSVYLVVLGTNDEDGIGIADSSCRRRIEMPNWVAFGVSSSEGLVDILAKKKKINIIGNGCLLDDNNIKYGESI